MARDRDTWEDSPETGQELVGLRLVWMLDRQKGVSEGRIPSEAALEAEQGTEVLRMQPVTDDWFWLTGEAENQMKLRLATVASGR